MRNYATPTLSQLILIWLLALPALWFSLVRAPELLVDIGAWSDHAMLHGVNSPEESSTETYRWTTAHADLILPNLSAGYRLLTMRAHGWRPSGASPQVQLVVNGQPWGSIQTSVPLRVYQVLLPENAGATQQEIAFNSETYQPPGDPRLIGFAIDWVALRTLGTNVIPAPWQFAGQALLFALVLALAALLCIYPRITGAMAILALLALNLSEPLWVSLALVAWLIVAACTILAIWATRLWLERWLQPWMTTSQARIALALLAAGLVLRMAGAVHPFFDAHDLPVHARWMKIVAGGQLYLYSTPGELQNRLTFNPPAGYLLLLPLWLLVPDLRLVVQAGTALIDWAGLALLLPLIYVLGIRPRAALLALALYAALPINLTMLWWGFATNDIAQTLWILLLWLILWLTDVPVQGDIGRRHVTTALFVSIIAAMCAMTHAGALVLVVAMLGLLGLASVFVLPKKTWLWLAGTLLLAGLLTTIVYFSAAVAPVLSQPASPQSRTLAESLARGMQMRNTRLALVSQAFERGFTPLLLAILPSGLLLLWRIPRHHRLLQPWVAVSLLISLLFLCVYMGLGFLTRYIYFAAPLVCIAAGVAFDTLMRSPAGKRATITLVLIVALIGIDLWFGGVLLRNKPSVVPLTH